MRLVSDHDDVAAVRERREAVAFLFREEQLEDAIYMVTVENYRL
jgi:hypothetical protein